MIICIYMQVFSCVPHTLRWQKLLNWMFLLTHFLHTLRIKKRLLIVSLYLYIADVLVSINVSLFVFLDSVAALTVANTMVAFSSL